MLLWETVKGESFHEFCGLGDHLLREDMGVWLGSYKSLVDSMCTSTMSCDHGYTSQTLLRSCLHSIYIEPVQWVVCHTAM